ncbi:MAG: CcmD family protein [Deltaproteobacteria bacterium]|nr:CcmD family protein [Deltaproteobacteria bacterium]
MDYLLTANVCVWIGIGLYTLVLWAGQRRIERRLQQLEGFGNDR